MVYVKITHIKDYKNTSKSEILGILTKRFTTTVYVCALVYQNSVSIFGHLNQMLRSQKRTYTCLWTDFH